MRVCYLIDRNISILINRYVEGKGIENTIKKLQIEEIKRLDIRSNFISLVLSLYEESYGRRTATEEEFNSAIDNECKNISLFFHNAKTDFPMISQPKLRDSFYKMVSAGDWEADFPKHNEFLNTICPLIHQPLSGQQAQKIKDEILEKAVEYGLQPSHPTVTLSLAVAFGNPDARGIIKPKQSAESYHNALGDIFSITRFNIWKHMILTDKDNKKFDQVLFFTFDKSLEKIQKTLSMEINSLNITNNGIETQRTYSYPNEMMPNLSEKKFEELCNEIRNLQDINQQNI